MRLTSSAVHIGRHLDGHVKVHSLGLGETVGTGHVVSDLEGDLTGGSQRVASWVQVTLLIVSYYVIGDGYLHTSFLTV